MKLLIEFYLSKEYSNILMQAAKTMFKIRWNKDFVIKRHLVSTEGYVHKVYYSNDPVENFTSWLVAILMHHCYLDGYDKGTKDAKQRVEDVIKQQDLIAKCKGKSNK